MLIMLDEGMRWARHFVQRRFAVGVSVRKEVGVGGDDEGDALLEDVVEVECVELRRRKGMRGRR